VVGQFRNIGQTAFPGKGDRLPCTVYEWVPAKSGKHGKFRIEFLSPDWETGRRCFYIRPLLDQWISQTPTDFLETACVHGCKVVAQLEQHSAAQKALSRVAQALFRNRNRPFGLDNSGFSETG